MQPTKAVIYDAKIYIVVAVLHSFPLLAKDYILRLPLLYRVWIFHYLHHTTRVPREVVGPYTL